MNVRDWPDFFQLYPDAPANRAIAAAGRYTPYILLLPNAASGCAEDASPRPIGNAAQFAQLIAADAGLDAGAAVPVTIGGLTGVEVDVSRASGYTGCVPGAPLGEPASVADRYRFVVLDKQGGGAIMIRIWAPADFDAFLAQAMPVVTSFRFDPTP